jgi:uncharacterized protein
MLTISELNIYPVKSCRGISLSRVAVEPAGFQHDREWMIVRPDGRFVTQREQPKLALIMPVLNGPFLVLSAPEGGELRVPLRHDGAVLDTVVWRDVCPAIDAGDTAAAWLTRAIGQDLRLVRFHPNHRRLSALEWTAGVEAENRFTDGYPVLVLSEASLQDLNTRLPESIPMNRFRPNLVVNGLPPYGEDEVYELGAEPLRLRGVKPCTRCIITTTDQATGIVTGPEPIRTLKSYRLSRNPAGVLFGYNFIVAAGAGSELRVGMKLEVHTRPTQVSEGLATSGTS